MAIDLKEYVNVNDHKYINGHKHSVKECVFCLDEIDEEFNLDFYSYEQFDNVCYYGNVKFNCNHIFHNKCFFKYCTFLISENEIKCPLCRNILNKELLNNINKYETILIKIISFLSDLKDKSYNKLLYTKCKLNLKKMFNCTVYLGELYKYNKLNNIYKKINTMKNELSTEYNKLFILKLK